MDFGLSEEQREVQKLAREILSEQVTPEKLARYDEYQQERFDQDLWDQLAKAGFDPRESVKLWQNMNSSQNTTKVPEFLSTHPSGEARIEAMVSRLPEALALYNQARADGLEPNCKP